MSGAKAIFTSQAPAPFQAIVRNDTVYCSGMVGLDQNNVIVSGAVARHTILEPIENELAEQNILQEWDRHQDSSGRISTRGIEDSHGESEPNTQSPGPSYRISSLPDHQAVLPPEASASLGESGPNVSTQPSKQEHRTRCALLSLKPGPQSTTFEWDERRDVGNGAVSHSANVSPRGIASTKAFLRMIGIGDGIYPHPGHTQRPIPNPSQMQLPLLTDSIDASFARCHPIYPTMHESMFHAQMMELVDRPSDDIWQMLLYTVAALGAFSVPTDKNDADMALFEVAKAQFLNEMMEVGNISVVQALVLMSVYLRNRYKLNSSYSFLGLANRIAMGIGLYKEFPSSTSFPFFRGTRWCLWCCFYTLNLEDSIAYSSLKISRRAKSNVHDLI